MFRTQFRVESRTLECVNSGRRLELVMLLRRVGLNLNEIVVKNRSIHGHTVVLFLLTALDPARSVCLLLSISYQLDLIFFVESQLL